MEEVESIGWDFHNLGVFNADMSQYDMAAELVDDDDEQYKYYSSFDDHFSTGYLQDVLFEFTSKRRRLAHDTSSSTTIKECWTSNLIHNFNTTLTQMAKCDTTISAEVKSPEEAISETSSISSHKDNLQWTPEKGNLYCLDPIFSSAGGAGSEEEKIRKKRVVAKVVYPFAVVKPGGFEGDATLNDINERILMPPTRPVRHPVGDFACRPLVSPDGPGLSGKAVVAFTRIHTQGRGTITIIRTRD